MFLAHKVPKELAIGYAGYIQNLTLSSKGEITPYEALHGKKKDVSSLRIFGSPHSFMYLTPVAGGWIQKQSKGYLLVAVNSQKPIASGSSKKGKSKSVATSSSTNQHMSQKI
jgi:hypothetical protein